MQQKIWEKIPIDEEKAMRRVDETKLPLSLTSILDPLSDNEDISEFLEPTKMYLDNANNLPNIAKVVEFLWSRVDTAKILIYGDYDADGVTASAVLLRGLVDAGFNCGSFIPNRHVDGYGLRVPTLEKILSASMPTIIMTVDCGVNSNDAALYATEKGVTLIITDHHEPSDGLAVDAFAVIDPKLGTDPDLMDLAGVGVAFKILQAMDSYATINNIVPMKPFDVSNLLPIVAIGTVADMVPLTRENRILVKAGFDLIKTISNPYISAIKRELDLDDSWTSTQVGFVIGPRINAAGRLGNARVALKLFLASDYEKAKTIVRALTTLNDERKQLVALFADIVMADARVMVESGKVGLVVTLVSANPGIVGIVASRISNEFNLPCIVLNIGSNDVVTGSCRSVHGIDLIKMLDNSKEYLTRYGGHKAAAGVALQVDNIDKFAEAFNKSIELELQDVDITQKISYIAELDLGTLNLAYLSDMDRLEPFGVDFPVPIFRCNNLRVKYSRIVAGKHLSVTLTDGYNSVKAIGFDMSTIKLPKGNVDIVCKVVKNNYMGSVSIQLHLVDIRATS